MKKVELLAPAGNFDALKGAVAAGADAVYLGADRYGARAFADNFSREEICQGIRFAHIFGRKIYLTVNTLVKEKELDVLYDFMLPFYESGLDGAIVQDLGVLRFLRTHFPELSLHASTQMTITGSGGAHLMRQEGIARIVPARELSLEEIAALKRESGLEIECFIHGAMCYCYSGQCLLSSLLGGRSGNRGRCAQPCRLPYETAGKKDCYPLSMRDMCTVEYLPELIRAGIDSFKIEGRMKKPAYAAGVTAIYRKYIDLYYENQNYYEDQNYSANQNYYQVAAEDLELLQSLYIRSQTGDGYYHRRNGRDMISLSSPAYTRTSPELLASIEQKYIRTPPCRGARAGVVLRAGERAALSLTLLPDKEERARPAIFFRESACGNASDSGRETVSVRVQGDLVQRAERQPLTPEKIREQIRKSGNSLIRIEQVSVESDGAVFLPVGSLNELRRKAVLALEEELARRQGPDPERRRFSSSAAVDTGADEGETRFSLLSEAEAPGGGGLSGFCRSPEKEQRAGGFCRNRLQVSVRTPQQLSAALAEGVGRIYADYGLSGALPELLKTSSFCPQTTQIYGATPYIVRKKDIVWLEKIWKLVECGLLKGILIRNLESFSFFRDRFQGKLPAERLVLDCGLYLWNRQALKFWEGRAGEFFLPAECNGREWRELLSACPDRRLRAGAVVYGYLPVMISANCLKKTFRGCEKKPGLTWLKDRCGKRFPVYTDCLCCYNVIFNSVPLSFHRQMGKLALDGGYRMDLTLEDEETSRRLIRYFAGLGEGYGDPFYTDYTTGHYKRGVE